jgi:membrane-bound ClpP family serine protease
VSRQNLSGQNVSEQKLSAQDADKRELEEEALDAEEPDAEELDDEELDEEELDDEAEAHVAEALPARNMPALLRVLGIVVVFLFIGPPIGGYSLLVIAFVLKAATHGIDWARLSNAFVGAVFFTAVFSYVFGGMVAFLTGVLVCVSRLAGGSTGILTPIFATLAANGAALLINSMIATKSLEPSLPGKLPLTAGLLPASLFAAILCWRLTKRWNLA